MIGTIISNPPECLKCYANREGDSIKRLRELEKRIAKLIPVPTLIEIEIDGCMQRMTVPEFIASGHDFFQGEFVSECSLKDAIALLDTIPSCIQ